MRTIIYIDWFNLNYGLIENSGYRWVDFSTLFNSILKSHHDIVAIKLFTANLLAIGKNQLAKIEQENYHNAISSYNPNIKIVTGNVS